MGKDIIHLTCKYCTGVQVPIILKKIEGKWIPFDQDSNGIGITMHVHRHEDQQK